MATPGPTLALSRLFHDHPRLDGDCRLCQLKDPVLQLALVLRTRVGGMAPVDRSDSARSARSERPWDRAGAGADACSAALSATIAFSSS